MQVNPLHPLFAAELVDADLTAPPDEALVRTVEEAMARYGVLAIRDAEISDEQQKDFSRAFGPLEIPSRVKGAARPIGTRPITPGIFYAGNLDHNGEIIPYGSDPKSLAKGPERFHTDSSFHAMPTKWSLLHGVETPPPSAGGAGLSSPRSLRISMRRSAINAMCSTRSRMAPPPRSPRNSPARPTTTSATR